MNFPAMNNGGQTPAVETSSSSAFSFISKGWKEVGDSADADLQLMKDRGKWFKNITASFDREIQNLKAMSLYWLRLESTFSFLVDLRIMSLWRKLRIMSLGSLLYRRKWGILINSEEDFMGVHCHGQIR
ncbi:hypothetical protein V6Z12_A11G374300 [Gossypium hirsutum]